MELGGKIRIVIMTILLALSRGGAHAQTKAPNIIFILADDLGVGDIGCYGQQKIQTPNIDALAAQGMRYTHFYAGTAVCAPSRASMMTGMHTGHTPIRGNRGFKPEGQFPLPDSSLTIASVLRDRGYLTADFGKWGLGYPGSTGEPLKKGFSVFYGYNCQTEAHNYYPDHLWQNDKRVELTGNKTGDSIYSADLIQGQAMEFLRQRKDRPFFLFLSYTLPHAALTVPHDEVYRYYVDKFKEAPQKEEAGKLYEKAAFEPYPHAAYAAMVARLDRYVGELVKEVDGQGIAGNTLILFSSDNGPHREGGNDPEFFNSSGIYRGIKRDLYEGGIRVPFIARWKGTIKAGVTSDLAAAFWDLFPTFGEMAGVRAFPGIDGISILPSLLGKAGQQPVHDYLYWEFHENEGRQAVLWHQWKGVRLRVSKLKDAPIELYDLGKDPAEKNNLAGQHPEIVRKLAGIMQEAHRPNKDWPLLVDELASGSN